MNLSSTKYPLREPDAIPSPALLVYRSHVEANIERMRSLLEEVAPRSDFSHLRPHVKTHKSSWTARLQRGRGIDRFKATPQETRLLVEAGACDIFVSYPLLHHAAHDLASLAATYRDVCWAAQIATIEHARLLETAAREAGALLDVYLDIDVGMHRTGAPPEAIARLHADVFARPGEPTPWLRYAGLHAYDGHIKSAGEAEREDDSRRAMSLVVEIVERLAERGVRTPAVIAGGTPGFLPDLKHLLARLPAEIQVEVSPGTWIYWDTNYDEKMPGLFEIAAVILARVMDRPQENLVTLDLGHKRWAIDCGPVDRFSVDGLEFVSASEEHTVLRRDPDRAPDLQIGDIVLIAPRHVCATVNLWEYFSVIGPGGEIEIAHCPVDGRNR